MDHSCHKTKKKNVETLWEIDLLKHKAPKRNLPEADILAVVKQALVFKERWRSLWEEAKESDQSDHYTGIQKRTNACSHL